MCIHKVALDVQSRACHVMPCPLLLLHTCPHHMWYVWCPCRACLLSNKYMMCDALLKTPESGNAMWYDFALGLSPGLLSASQPRRPAAGVWCTARNPGVRCEPAPERTWYTQCLQVAGGDAQRELLSSLVRGGGLPTNTGGGNIGHARGTQPECPDKLSFAPQGHFNTSKGCRLAAVLLAMMISLAVGVFVWLVLKAKGMIVAGLAAEILKVLEMRAAQASQHGPAARGLHAGSSGPPQAEEDRGFVQDFSTVESEDRRTLASPEPWGTDELVSFASSLARQVAKKLSTQEDLVQGVVERFAEDLLRLSRGPGEPSQAAMPGVWQQGPEDLLWWPMWWCPFPSQWSEAGADEAPFTAVDELAACSPAEVGVQAPESPNPGVQTCRAKPTRRGNKRKKKAAESCVVLQVSEPECELSERSGPSSVQGESDSSIEDLFATAEGGGWLSRIGQW